MNGIRIACFSARGEALARRLALGEVRRFPGSRELSEWTGEGFREADALIFIGACGIAVRAIAPFVQSKLTDPAVLVIDESAQTVIPLLSGHIGGANDLACRIAEKLGAQAVITTATDRRNAFAADSWAAETGFGIVNPEAVRQISAAVLDGEEIVLSVRRKSVSGVNPPAADLAADTGGSDFGKLILVPRTIVIGAGCRKGTDPGYLEECFAGFCTEHGIEEAAVGCAASIDLKKEEPALKILCARRKIPFLTFSAKELMKTKGSFSSSEFVMEKTGTDNVCERAAVRASLVLDDVTGGEQNPAEDAEDSAQTRLLIRKTVYDGITFAAARARTVRSWKWLPPADTRAKNCNRQ